MKNSSFYDLTAVSFSDRETFSNAIILLSMVKSEAYYIVGFSRPGKKIEIGFDFKSSFNSTVTQTFTMKLNDPCRICFRSVLKDLNIEHCKQLIKQSNKNFYISGGDVIYESYTDRDEIIPMSIENIDKAVKRVKQEIIDFTEEYFEGVYNCS